MLQPGLKTEATQEVTSELSAPHLGSGSLQVYATPAMAAFIEGTCRKLVEPFLKDGQATVGTHIDLRHLAPTPVGGIVRTKVEMVKVEGGLLHFQAQVWDDQEKVGEAMHSRMVIEVSRFMKRVSEKGTARQTNVPSKAD